MTLLLLDFILDNTKTGAVHFAWGGTAPAASIIKVLLERRCLTAFRSPVFDTTSPGVGGILKPSKKHVTGISPLRGSLRAARGQAYHCVLTGSLRDSLSSCFVDGWVPLTTLHWPSFMREIPHRWVLAHPPESLSAFGGPPGNVFQLPDIQFSRCKGAYWRPPDGENCARILFITIKSSPTRVGFNRWSRSSCLGDSLLAEGRCQFANFTPPKRPRTVKIGQLGESAVISLRIVRSVTLNLTASCATVICRV